MQVSRIFQSLVFVFLDDIMIEDCGIVNIEETEIKDPIIYKSSEGILVEATSNWEGAKLTIYNASGQIVLETTYSENNKNVYKRQLESGLYIIRLVNKENQFSKKLINN